MGSQKEDPSLDDRAAERKKTRPCPLATEREPQDAGWAAQVLTVGSEKGGPGLLGTEAEMTRKRPCSSARPRVVGNCS